MTREEFETALEKAVEAYTKAKEEIVSEDPDFLPRTIHSLALSALHSVRYYLEQDTEESVSWLSPWCEIQYPVPWDPEAWGIAWGVHVSKDMEQRETVPLSPAALQNPKKTVEAVAPLLTQNLEIVALSLVTNGVVIGLEEDAQILSLLPWSPHHDEMKEIPEGERENRFSELAAPYILGGFEEDDEDLPVSSPDLGDRFEAPALPFEAETDSGERVSGRVIIQFHPLVVNVVEERTYYPIVAGLVFSEGDPSSWSSADKGELWGDLLDSFERIWTDHFPEEEGPPSEVSVEAGEDSMLVRTSPEAAPVRLGIGVPFGPAMVSSEALEVVQNSHRVRLPSRLSNTPRLEDLVEREVEKLLEEEGDRAFTDLKKETGDPEERGRLLKKVYKAGGGEIVQLTAEGERRLKRTHGLGKPGFIERDQLGREFLVKMFETGKGGLLEIGLSWSGLAGPLVTEWVEQQKARAKQAQKELSEPLLFAELDQERREQVDRMVRQISLWKGGRLLMEVILGQVGRQGRNPVEIKADAFRVVLWPKRADARTWPPNWKQHVENILSTLMSLEFKYGGSLRGRVGESSFVSEWSYTPRGSGGHGEGVYTIRVGQIFLGCLAAFESGKERLRSGKESIRYNFRQKLPRGELGGRSFVTFDAGRPFYNAAAGLSPHQENLLTFLERQITLKGDGVRKDSRTKKAKKGTPEARERRQYGSDFCPILPEGQVFLGALGHFPNNAELGRTLYGTASKKARKHAGLIAEMGYVLPPGRAQSVREGVVQKALEDLKAVVVDYLGGVVVGHYGDVWVPLQDFGKMVDEDTLCRRLKILCFFPIDYETKRREKWEETVGRKATNDLREAERDAWTTTDEAVLKGDGNVADPPSGWPLHVRLHAAMKERDLRQKDLASLFGVSAPTISYWLKGTEPDENGEVRGKPIPEDVAPLMVRWIETEESPSSEELSVFKERRDRERKKALQRRKRLS